MGFQQILKRKYLFHAAPFLGRKGLVILATEDNRVAVHTELNAGSDAHPMMGFNFPASTRVISVFLGIIKEMGGY